MRRTLIVLLVACATLLGVGTAAQPPQKTEENGLKLTLAECLQKALENNLDLVSARKDPEIAAQGIEVQKAPFDPTLGADATYQGQASHGPFTEADLTAVPPVVSSEEITARSRQLTADVNFGQKVNFGGNYQVSWNYADSPTNSGARLFGPGLLSLFDSKFRSQGLVLSWNMPLLRGFGKEVNTVNILLARNNLDISWQSLSLLAQTTMEQVESAYWDLVAAREARTVAHESLDLAQQLYDLNKKKVEVGTLAPIEITQAEAGVASRQEDVIIAETNVVTAEDNLRKLMAIPKDDPAWSETILPTDTPQYEVRTVDVNASIAKALELRPEMLTARQQLRNSELSERVARHETRHSLNLTADINPTYTADASSGSLRTTTGESPTSTVDQRTYANAWSVGLVYSFPIFNRAAKANYAIATINREKSDVAVQNTEQTIRVDVRNAARNVESGVQRVAAARANVVLQKKTLEAEQKKFENGMSTSFEVLRIQTDLSSARLAEIQAVLAYVKALADLERAQGTLLEARGLKLERAPGR